MLQYPFLARCEDRSVIPREHPSGKNPDTWLAPPILKYHSFKGISFDFFIDWSTSKFSPLIWVKAILKPEYTYKDFLEVKEKELEKHFGVDTLQSLVEFGSLIQAKVELIIYRDDFNWEDDSSTILRIEILKSNEIEFKALECPLKEIKQIIRDNSGGAVKIGRKGLIYGTSLLECALSKTNSLYPGDADLLILNDHYEPVAILEYKKHNLNGDISYQRLSNYYPNPDARKYNRLAILRDHINSLGFDIPIIILYYPTRGGQLRGKIELIGGAINSLKTVAKGFFSFNPTSLNESTIGNILLAIKHHNKQNKS